MEIFADNLKYLRKLYDETQSQLADAIGISQHAISQYEKKKHYPDIGIRQSIANHYNVPVETLSQKKLEFPINLISWESISNSTIAKWTQITYPILKTDKAMENEDFAAALEQHVLLRNHMLGEDIHGIELVPISVFNQYEVAAKAGVLEAKANMISLVLLVYSYELEIHASTNFGNDSSTKEELTTECFKAMLNPTLLDDRMDYIEIVQETFYDYLRDLKRSGTWSDLADYYIIMLYRYNLFEEDALSTESMEVADHLSALAFRLKNKYIIQLVKEYLRLTNGQ